jgi:CheY-like chemotaxis protein
VHEAETSSGEIPAPQDSGTFEPLPLPLAGMCVVVVDDEADARELLEELFRRSGAVAYSAGSAAEGLVLVRTHRPDLLVSDLAMPEADGYDLLSHVRALPEEAGGKTIAIALTAHARRTDRLKVLASGFAAYLAKPVEPAELIATVRKATRSSGSHRSLSVSASAERN